jgi:hypothetical protein
LDTHEPITAADLLNDRVLPVFDSHRVKQLRVLTDRGSEYCGNPERDEYELYLAIENIDQLAHQDQEPANERYLRALAQDRVQRTLPRRLPQRGVPLNR